MIKSITWKNSIKSKMIASNLLIFLITIISINIFSIVETRSSLERATIQQLEITRVLKADSLRLWISEIKNDMQWLMEMDYFREMVIELSQQDTNTQTKREVKQNLINKINTLKNFKRDWQEVFILSIDGEIILSSKPEREGDYRTLDKYFLEGKQGMYLQKIYPSPITYGPTLTISSPILDRKGTAIAVVAIHIELLRLDEIIFEGAPGTYSGESFLVDSYGALVSSKKLGNPDYLRGVKSFGVDQAIARQPGTALYENFDGKAVIGSFSWIDEIDAGLVVEIPQHIAFSPLLSLTLSITIFGVIISIALLALIYLFAAQISDPIRKVIELTQGISKGQFNQRLEIKSEDETGVLARSVNIMSENLELALEQLSKAKDRAESATIAKSNFLANMSHEIRTPMNSVLGYAQLIARHPGIDHQVEDYLQRIQMSGQHLMDLLNTILDLSKIESGESSIVNSVFELDDLAKELSGMFEFRCSEKGLLWSFSSNFYSSRIIADKLRLKQVLINLINNAIKFTEKGEISLTINRERPCHYRFEVKDTGRGISPDSLSLIFKPFQQELDSDQKLGTGLGLTIASNLIRDMGGRIEVESVEGRGSLFYFELDFDESESDQIVTKEILDNPVEVGIALVVDDIEDNRLILKTFLDELGFETREAQNGLEALIVTRELARKGRSIAVIFLDILMPVMDGKSAFKEIIALNLKPSPKIIAVSASTLAHEKGEIIDMGFDGFISKPVSFENVARILGQDLLSATMPSPPKTQQPSESFDLIVSQTILDEGIEACKIYHLSKLNECIAQIAEIDERGARIAAELRQHMKDLNMDAIERIFDRLSKVDRK